MIVEVIFGEQQVIASDIAIFNFSPFGFYQIVIYFFLIFNSILIASAASYDSSTQLVPM